jgi:hypothetical protein
LEHFAARECHERIGHQLNAFRHWQQFANLAAI